MTEEPMESITEKPEDRGKRLMRKEIDEKSNLIHCYEPGWLYR